MKSKKWILTIILCLSLTACGNATGTKGTGDQKDSEYSLDKIDSEVIEGNTSFAWDVFKELSQEEELKSTFISPFSISTALSMTYQGANGETKQEMEDVLGYSGLDMETINQSYQHYIRYMTQLNDVKVNVGNSIWIRDEYPIKEDFLNTNQSMYEAGVFERDFSKSETVSEINNWISQQTNGKIDSMLSDPISPSIKMFLINAIYFKGDWKKPFEKEHTKEGSFYVTQGNSKQIPMMVKEDSTAYYDSPNLKAIEMPYGEGNVSMYAVLPKQGNSLSSLVKSMDDKTWNKITEEMSKQDKVNISFPKFKVEYGKKELNGVLQTLGMKKAFFEADFSGMTDRGLKIDQVLHKALIEVNEEGSEAAGATVVSMEESAAAQPITFKADRPFLYVIQDNETNSILFMGTYYGEAE